MNLIACSRTKTISLVPCKVSSNYYTCEDITTFWLKFMAGRTCISLCQQASMTYQFHRPKKSLACMSQFPCPMPLSCLMSGLSTSYLMSIFSLFMTDRKWLFTFFSVIPDHLLLDGYLWNVAYLMEIFWFKSNLFGPNLYKNVMKWVHVYYIQRSSQWKKHPINWYCISFYIYSTKPIGLFMPLIYLLYNIFSRKSPFHVLKRVLYQQ